MSYLSDTPPDELAREGFEQIRQAFGFLPNFFRAQTLRSDLIDAEIGLIGTTLIKDGALTRQQKEYIFLTCSAANLSTYCVTAHCEIVRMLGLEGPEPERIAVDYTSTNLSMSMKALLNFANKLNSQPTKVTQGDVNALRTFGYSDQQILETVVTVGVARFANVVAAGLGTVLDFNNPDVVFGSDQPLAARGQVSL